MSMKWVSSSSAGDSTDKVDMKHLCCAKEATRKDRPGQRSKEVAQFMMIDQTQTRWNVQEEDEDTLICLFVLWQKLQLRGSILCESERVWLE